MKCKFCNNNAGFLRNYHKECFDSAKTTISAINHILNKFKDNTIDKNLYKQQIIEEIDKNKAYSIYLNNSVYQNEIFAFEKIIYFESNMSVSESKNRCIMTRTGISYRRYPVWTEKNILIAKIAEIILTDKSILISFNNFDTINIPYSKITDVHFERFRSVAVLELKTKSIVPHKIYLRPYNCKEKHKPQNLTLLISCLK